MKKLILILTLIVGTSWYSIAQQKQYLTQTKISEDLYYSKITDSIFMITHYFPYWGGNSMFVLLPNGKGVLIDTPYETTGTKSLLDWIINTFGDLRLTAIVTGFHQDNLGGDELLISKGIDIYGADLTKELVIEEGDSLKKLIIESVKNNENKKYFESYSNLKLVPPNNTFPIHEGLRLAIENENFEVYFPGESHTIDNTVVYLHKSKILFGGCMLKGYMYKTPGYLGFANMDEWPKSIENVIERFPDCEIVVPGHGDYGGKDILNHSLKIVNEWNEKTASH
jgi:metallo-beta-lactamase class B